MKSLPINIMSVVFVLLAALAGGIVQAQSQSKSIADALQPFVENRTIAGAVTLVAGRDEVLSLDCVGYADLAAKKPMQRDNLFWIASMTKPVTAAAVLMLEDEGKLSIEDPVDKYLPELAKLKMADGKPARLTLQHLLTHTSGMAEATKEESRAAVTLADLIPGYAKKPLQFEPGSKWRYCQSGINSLGRIVEVVSRQSFPDFLQKRLFDPLAMKDTTFYPTEAQVRAGKILQGERRPVGRSTDLHSRPAQSDVPPPLSGRQWRTVLDSPRLCTLLSNAAQPWLARWTTVPQTRDGKTDGRNPHRRSQNGLHRWQRLGIGVLRGPPATRYHGRVIAGHVWAWRSLRHASMD